MQVGIFVNPLGRLFSGKVARLALGQGGEFAESYFWRAIDHMHKASNILKYYARQFFAQKQGSLIWKLSKNSGNTVFVAYSKNLCRESQSPSASSTISCCVSGFACFSRCSR